MNRTIYIKHWMLTLFATFVSLSVSAYDFMANGIYYDINSDQNTCTVTYGDEKYSGDIVIPSQVSYKGKMLTVTNIGVDAFRECRDMTSVSIPSFITSIGANAFNFCKGLTSIEFPSSLISIDDAAFMYCSNLKTLNIPNSVKSIGSEAFYYCDGLTSVRLSNSLTRINSSAFQYCKGLLSLDIPSSVTSIGDGAFDSCTRLISVNLPSSIEIIENMAFYDCINLMSITIPISVTSIGMKSFGNCESIVSLDIPSSVKSIGQYAFEECTGLVSINIGDSTSTDNPTQKIYEYAFFKCNNLTDLYLGSTIKYIASSAFSGSVLGRIVSYNSVPPTIKDDAFTDYQYQNTTLNVNSDALSAYKEATGWKNFLNICTFSNQQSGIEKINIIINNESHINFYDLQGHKLNTPQRGINIINGKKVMIK